MASPANLQITQGSGTRLATASYTEGGVTVHDEKMIFGEQYLPTYAVNGTGVSIATSSSHSLQLMAGSSLNVYIRRVMVYQLALATTAAVGEFRLFRLTTAGTGGTSLSEPPFDPAHGAAGAEGMTLPTVKGTEGERLWIGSNMLTQTVPTAGGSNLMFDLVFDGTRLPALKIPAGTSNGIVLKNLTSIPGATIQVNFFFSEASF